MACGAKVEVVESNTRINKEVILAKEPFYVANPKLLDFVLKEKTKSRLRKNFPEIFTASSEDDRINTGYSLLGYENMKEMEESTSLLEWK